jgi:hypothetical protein
VVPCSGEGWGFYGRSNFGLGGVFSLDSQAFSGELVWFAPYWGGKTILGAFCSSALWQIYQTLYLFFRLQKCSLQLRLRTQESRALTP